MKKDFETEKEEIIKNEVEKAVKKLQISKKSSPKPQALITNTPPVVLNKLAPSNRNQTFTSSPAVRRKRKETEQPEQIVDEIVLGDYEIQFLDKDGKIVDEPQHAYQMEESGKEIEIIGESQLMEVEEVEEEESTDSDEEYKPLTVRKTRKFKVFETKSAKKKEKPSKSSEVSILVPQIVGVNQDDSYFIPVKADGDLDANGEKKIFQCSFENCRERFARRQACKTHFYNHITTKIVSNGFTCKFCQKYFKVASSLLRHERIHTGLKPFKCDFDGCEKAFSQKEMLKRHNAIHLSLKDAPFPCHLCDKKFRQKEPLRWHINKEHAEDSEVKVNSFMCSICNKPFAHSSGLSRHFLIHSGKTFSCEICGKSFNDKSALKRHGNIHNK